MAGKPDFKGKVVLITGAGSGIGAATAKLFYDLGASLSLVDINADDLDRTNQEFTAVNEQPKPFFQIGDISNDEFCKAFIDSTIKQFGRIDVLVSNAGIAPHDTFETTSLEMFDRAMSIYFRAPFHLTLLVTPQLKKYKGNIVNISSCSSQTTTPISFSYSITKDAIDTLTQASAAALGENGIRVNNVKYANCASSDIAKVVTFLASDFAGSVTGINMLVDGGLGIRYH